MLLNLAFSEAIECERSFMYKPAELDKHGTVLTPVETREDPDVTPVVHSPWCTPVPVQELVKAKLDRMVDRQVITPVSEPTEWVSSMVATVKKDKKDVCICIDPWDLNKVILRPHYPSRTIEEVIARMPGAKVFSILDTSTGVWQFPFDHESLLAITFNSPYGRFHCLRLPYRLISTSEVYQKAMDHLFTELPCKNYHQWHSDLGQRWHRTQCQSMQGSWQSPWSPSATQSSQLQVPGIYSPLCWTPVDGRRPKAGSWQGQGCTWHAPTRLTTSTSVLPGHDQLSSQVHTTPHKQDRTTTWTYPQALGQYLVLVWKACQSLHWHQRSHQHTTSATFLR